MSVRRSEVELKSSTVSAVEVQPGEIIRCIQEQLLDAQLRREADGVLPLFEVQGLEIEMRVCISTTKTASGKLDLKILAVTKDTAIDEQHVHTVRLTLKAVDTDGGSGVQNGRRPSSRRLG